jgi:hypothetical protein
MEFSVKVAMMLLGWFEDQLYNTLEEGYES